MKKDSKIKVLSLGYLPKEYEGKQKTGLSYAIYEIARNIGKYSYDIDYIVCCTDYNSNIKKIIKLDSGIKVIGWRKIDLIYFTFQHPILSLYLIIQSIKYILKYRYIINFIKVFGTLIFYSSVLKYHRFDVLHIHGTNKAVLANYIPDAKNILKVTTLHGVIGFDKNLPKECHKIERDTLKINSFFTFVSKGTQETLLSQYKVTPERYQVIQNGIDINKFSIHDRKKCRKELGFPLNKKIFLTVGGLSKLKGQRKILRAVSLLSDDIQEKICLIFVGNNVNSIRRNVPELKCDLFLYEYIFQDALVKIYNSADYHLSASSSEGFGMVLTESLACGTPVVIPRSCDIATEDFIIDGRNSVIYEKATVTNIKKVIKKTIRKEFDKSIIRKSVSHLGWRKIAKSYCEVFISELSHGY